MYLLLSGANLSRYYQIKESGASFCAPSPIKVQTDNYSYLDDSAIAPQYELSQHPRRVRFFLDGVHCVACVWILEQLQQLNPDIVSSRFNMAKSVITVEIAADKKMAPVAKLLSELGYTPYPLKVGETSADHQALLFRRSIIRIGIAGAAAGNIMLLAVCRYAGLGGLGAIWFDAIMALLALPLVTYVAAPFYTSAWGALRLRKINIDLPVSLAIFLGYSISVLNLLMGHQTVYFDSISMFVFLLLSTRTFFLSTHSRYDDTRLMTHRLLPAIAKRLGLNQEIESVESARLVPGDVIVVSNNEIIPIDGTLLTAESYFDTQLLTGESAPLLLRQGGDVFGGTRNVGNEIHIRVATTSADCRISKLIQKIENLEKPSTVQWADLVASRLIGAILLGSSALFVWTFFHQGLEPAINQYLAFILISCPCALAIATPLTYAFAQQQALSKGIVTLRHNLFDKLKSVSHLFFDKTGTLTTGQIQVSQIKVQNPAQESQIFAIISLLEASSTHPIAVSIRRYLSDKNSNATDLSLSEWTMIPGKGISGTIDRSFYELIAVAPDPNSAISNRIELRDAAQNCLAVIELQDQILPETVQEIADLQRGYSCAILSGDHPIAVEKVGKALSITQLYSQKTPEEKQLILSEHPHSVMVGDGDNDAAALKQAWVGVSVRGGFEASIQSSDALIIGNGISGIGYLLKLGRRIGILLPINLGISLLYNGVGIGLVVAGRMSPLGAAILMPVSALTVLTIAYWGIRRA